ncbi:MAG: hypothetical protein COA82_13390 [Alkaliphilus sp.]|nr:MAG: hypothetical protein COA82_13390 [Alkaliphilus sp.]
MESTKQEIVSENNEGRDVVSERGKHNKDRSLVHRYLCGDSEAGQELYAALFPTLKGYIYGHLSMKNLSEQEKEEVFSNTLKTSIEKLGYYNGKSSFSTYVCGIAKYKMLEKVKANKRETDKVDRVIELSEIVCGYSDPLKILVEKEMLEAVVEAQRVLPEKYQQILNLRLNGMSAKQVAKLAQMTESAVNSTYYRAIRAFKKKFENLYK